MEPETAVLDFPTRSASIAQLATALAKAQGEMEGAAKDSTNPHFKSKYADLASVWEACRKPLAKHELAILQPVTADGQHVTVTTILAHSSGEWISEALTMVAAQNTPQAVGSTITYGRRYGLSAMVGIAPEDDDGEAGTARGLSDPAPPRREPAAPPSGRAVAGPGDVGPVVIASVGAGRAGALAEIVLTNGDRYLTYKAPVKRGADAASASCEAVMLTIKKSTSGNLYVDGISATGMTADDLDATKFKHTTTVDDKDLPF